MITLRGLYVVVSVPADAIKGIERDGLTLLVMLKNGDRLDVSYPNDADCQRAFDSLRDGGHARDHLSNSICASLLRDLYNCQPLGRRAAILHAIVSRRVACQEADVIDALELLEANHLVCHVNPGELAPGLPPYWFITTAGMVQCEESPPHIPS